MRILHLDNGREMRGGQYQVLALAAGLTWRGHECRLLCRPGAPLAEEAKRFGVKVEPLRLLTLLRLSRWADLVHAHDARSHAIAAFTGANPLVVSRRVAFPVKRTAASRWVYSRAARYLAISRYVGRELESAGVPPAKIAVVYDGVAVPRAVAAGRRIVAVDTDDQQKGSDLLRSALALIHERALFSRQLDVDLPEAQVFVYLSRQEGLGSAALLAMAHGVPVVASRIGGLPEIVEDGVTGLLTDNDPAAIAEAIRRLRLDQDLAREMGRQGRERVEREFTIDQMVMRTEEEYKELLTCS